MRLGAKIIGAGFLPGRCRLLPVFVLLVWFGLAGMTARAADVPPVGPPPPADAQMSMSSAGWLERLVVQRRAGRADQHQKGDREVVQTVIDHEQPRLVSQGQEGVGVIEAGEVPFAERYGHELCPRLRAELH